MSALGRIALVIATVGTISAGCGRASEPGAATATSTGRTLASTKPGVAALRIGVRTAIRADQQLSIYVLWHNSVPAWATRSTRGPALTALRGAAKIRRKQGIQIKNLSSHYTVASITLPTSYVTATAVIRSQQRVAPYQAGHRLGKAISETDQARVELHRLGNTSRFVVWSVSPIQ